MWPATTGPTGLSEPQRRVETAPHSDGSSTLVGAPDETAFAVGSLALQLVQQCSYIVYACKKSAGKVRAVKASVCLHLANLPRFVNSCYEGHASFSLANGTLASLLARRPVVSRRDNAPKSSKPQIR